MFIDTLRSIDVKLKKLEEENSVIKGMVCTRMTQNYLKKTKYFLDC